MIEKLISFDFSVNMLAYSLTTFIVRNIRELQLKITYISLQQNSPRLETFQA